MSAVVRTTYEYARPLTVEEFERLPEGEGKHAEVLGEGAAAAPRVVEVLREIGVLA